uniref:Putative secreted protein n=1 Tax=Anopheles triannulatus TaxID=58253 RepID=A0A2M4B6U6_9DIPT
MPMVRSQVRLLLLLHLLSLIQSRIRTDHSSPNTSIDHSAVRTILRQATHSSRPPLQRCSNIPAHHNCHKFGPINWITRLVGCLAVAARPKTKRKGEKNNQSDHTNTTTTSIRHVCAREV